MSETQKSKKIKFSSVDLLKHTEQVQKRGIMYSDLNSRFVRKFFFSHLTFNKGKKISRKMLRKE